MWKLKLNGTREHAERLKFLAGAIEKFNAYEVDTHSAITDRLVGVEKPLEAWSDWWEDIEEVTLEGEQIGRACAVWLSKTAKRGSIIKMGVMQKGYNLEGCPALYFTITPDDLYQLGEEELFENIASGAYKLTGDASEVFDELYAALLDSGGAVELVRFDGLTDEEHNRVLAVSPAKTWLKVKDGEELSDLLTNTLLTEQTNRLNAVAENQTTLDV